MASQTKLLPQNVFARFNSDHILDMAESPWFQDEEGIYKSEDQKKILIAFQEISFQTGLEHALNKCTLGILESLDTGVEQQGDDEDDGKKRKPKRIVIEELTKHILNEGSLNKFLKNQKRDVLLNFAKKVGYKGNDEDEALAKIEETVYLNGLLQFLEQYDAKKLKEWCNDLDIEVKSTSKKRLALALIKGEDSGPRTVRRIPRKKDGNKPPLDKNISEADIGDYYTASELRDFCVTNDISNNGTKDVLVSRVHTFLQGGEVEKVKRTYAPPPSSEDSEETPEDEDDGDFQADEEEIADDYEPLEEEVPEEE